METALAALQSPNTCLDTVHLTGSNIPDTAMLMLSSFRTITECAFDAPKPGVIRLQPLQGLPRLTKLTLTNGNFSELEALAHLTSLHLQHADVVCSQDCLCVTSLVELSLLTATLKRFHRKGVPACLLLQSLECNQGFIGALDSEEEFAFSRTGGARVPSEMSALTAVTNLALHYPDCTMRLDWVTRLPGLEVFEVEAHRAYFASTWNCMTSLLKMLIKVDPITSHLKPNAKFSFDWSSLRSLVVVKLDGAVMLNTKMAGLALLQGLQEVWLTHMKVVDADTATEIGMLAFALGRARPDVEFHMYS